MSVLRAGCGLASIALWPAVGVAAQPLPPAAAAVTANADPVAEGARTARWQLANLPPAPPSMGTPAGGTAVDPALLAFAAAENPANPLSWHQATFWLGLSRLADRRAGGWAADAILAQGRASGWQPGQRLYNADDQLIGEAYLWAARHGAGRAAIGPLRGAFDRILADPPRVHLSLHVGPEGMRGYPKAECLKRWCWADALFMAPATWIGLSNATGDRRYRDHALAEFGAARDFLYDPAERLYFRDSRFFDLRDEAGRKIFWSRGNGWVLAGIARMLEALPPRDPERKRLEAHFAEFAGRVAALQKADGFWPSSLLDPTDATPESSGTALFTYAIAWGVGQGLLPRDRFEPVARRGWQALRGAVRADGALGWVQPAGDRPGKALSTATQIYANGAYLLAATAIADLDGKD